MADENKVVNYEGNRISLYAPEKAFQRDIAYVRPSDEIELNFDIRDQENIKVEVVKGDLHIIFANGSTLTIASMVAIGFSNHAPKLRTLDGRVLSLEEFLSVTEVLNYNEAVLILANKNQVEYSDEEPKIVQVSSDQDAENDAGIPITGQGNADLASQGLPTEVIDPKGSITEPHNSVSTGAFVSTIWTSNSPYTLDKTNYLPGDTTTKSLPNLQIKVMYGSDMNRQGSVNINNKEYVNYEFKNGFSYTDDPTAQLSPSVVSYSGSEDIFINNSTEDMNYVFNVNYARGVVPSRIEIVVPTAVSSFVKLAEGAGLDFANIQETAEGTVYTITNINPRGIMEFLLSFPENTQITNFDLTYNIGYLDPSSGEFLTSSTTTSLSIYPVTEESHLDKSNGFVLSSHANPVDVSTGTGDDIIVGGGGNNIVRSSGGNNKVFVYAGDDLIELRGGDDEVWGSDGNDLIDGGDGNNTLYYDNRNVDIDPTGNTFKDSYYNTNKSAAGLFAYVGFTSKELRDFATRDFKNYNKILDNSIFIKKSQGGDVINNFQTIYLSGYNDNLIVSDKIIFDNLFIDGGSTPKGKTDNDTLIIDDSFVDAVVKMEDKSLLQNKDGTTILTFANFEQVKGSKNSDIFYGNIVEGFTGKDTAYSIDGAGGEDTLTYEELTGSIEFDANKGWVQKKDANGKDAGIDKIKNINIIKASKGADIFNGSFTNNYIYQDLSAEDKVSYANSNSGVTLILDGNSNEYNIYKTTSYTNVKNMPDGLYKDTLQGSLNIKENLTLSRKIDIVIVSDAKESYQINAGAGRDVLSYEGLTEGLIVTFNDGKATVSKGSGGTDTFDTMVQTNADKPDQKDINIYKIIGTDKNDIFNMDDSKENKTGFFLDGRGGENTLSYEGMSEDTENHRGVSFVLSGGGNSTATRINSGIVDYFQNFQIFKGSKNDDTVSFSSTVKIKDINGLDFDLGDGTDTIIFNLLNPKESNHIEISFDGDNMIVTYEKGETTTFKNTEGVSGTAGDDIFNAVGGKDLVFNGYNGNDFADYSEVSDDLEFRMDIRNAPNVTKGSFKDTIQNVNHIKGGQGNNMYYLDAGVSYKIEGNGTGNSVSYNYSLSGIIYDLEKNTVSKGLGDNLKIDTLENVTSVKGSARDDIFVVSDNMQETVYNLYGNDALLDASGKPTTTPSNDSDKIDFSALSNKIDILLDTTSEGSYNEYEQKEGRNVLTKEGTVSINAAGVDFNLHHIEGLIGTKNGDTFVIKSSYDGSKGRSQWSIDGGDGEDTVDYSQDTNVGIVDTKGTWGLALDIDLSANGIRVYRNYVDDSGSLSRSEDKLTNIEKLILSDKDDVVNISTGWEKSGIKEIDAGLKNSDPKSKGDTLSFSGIKDEIQVDFDNKGGFKAEILGSKDLLPEFMNFDNIRLSQGKSTVNFIEGTSFTNIVTISASANRAAQAILDFSSLTSGLTITLGVNVGDKDQLDGGVKGEIIFETYGSRYQVNLSDQSNTIFGSALAGKHMDFKGTGTSNTLNYTNIDSVGLTIDYASSKVQKGTNVSVYDTFDSSFATIIGTNNAIGDTFLITADSIDLTNKNIDLGGQAGDNVLIELNSGAVYDIVSTTINEKLNISVVKGVDNINFGSKDDTIKFSSNFESNSGNMSYANYDGGTGNNTLDFSGMSRIIHDARSFQISKDSAVTEDFKNIKWAQGNTSSGGSKNLQFTNFYTIVGSNVESLFYGTNVGNFIYKGGTGNDTINYSQSLAAIQINLFNKEILKSTFKDTFDDKIDHIVGTKSNDTLIIDQNKTFDSDVTIDGGDGSDTVKFAFDKASGVRVVMKFEANGDTSFDLEKGSSKTPINVSFSNFESYELTENDDIVVRDSALSDNILIKAGDGNDEVNYIGKDDIYFEARTAKITKNNDASRFDTLNQVEIISYNGGQGKATFIGNLNSSYTYKGDSTRTTFDSTTYSDAVIDYSKEPPTSKITVDFVLKNGLMSILKESSISNTDYFDGYITKIIGTKGNDTFVLAERASSLPKIRLEGGGGTDYVSYGNLKSGATFKVDDNTGSVSAEGVDTFSNYDIDSNSIKGFTLTSKNDIFIGGATSEINIDGGDGIDTLDYSSLQGVNITVDFTLGKIQKVKGSKTKIDTFKNFESVKTGDGNDTIIINDSIISGSFSGDFDVGSGHNILNAQAITKDMKVEYGANYESKISYDGGKSYVYSGFQEITLGKGKNEVSYTHSSAYESENLRFTSYLGSKDVFSFKGSGTNAFFIDARASDTILIDTNSSGKGFITLKDFQKVSALNTTYELHIQAAGISGEHIFVGGSSNKDTIDYKEAVFSTISTVEEDSTGKQYIKILGGNNTFEDHLYDIDSITLSNNDDKFVVSTLTNYNKDNKIIVDAGGGTNNEVSLAGISKGGIFDAKGGVLSIEGYEFKNFQTMSLTGGNDLVKFEQSGNAIMNGNGGNDTADYATNKNTFTDGVVLSIGNNGTNDFINVNKKGSGDNDQLTSFETFLLTDHNDEFIYSGKGDGFGAISIDMGDGEDTVDFSGLDKSVTKTSFVYDGTKLTVQNKDTAGSEIDYSFKNMESVILGGTNSSLVLNSLSQVGSSGGISFDGGDASSNANLDLSKISKGTDITVNIFNETVMTADGKLGLSYKNFRSITGNSQINTYKMTELNVNGSSVNYEITTNNKNATITYKNEGVLGGIEFIFGGDDSVATVNKSTGGTDTFKDDFSTLIGTESGDTFKFTKEWQDGFTIDALGGSTIDTLDFSKLDKETSSTIKLNNTKYTEISSTVAGNKASFRNMSRLVTSTTKASTVTLDLTGIAVDYQNIVIIGTKLSQGSNTFNVVGTVKANEFANLNVNLNGSANYSTKIDNYTVSVNLEHMYKVSFENIKLDTTVSFEDYTQAGNYEITGNKDSNNTLDLSSSASNITINNYNFILNDLKNGSVITKTNNFQHIILGTKQDIITVITVSDKLEVNSGGSTAGSLDQLNIGDASNKLEASVLLTKSNVQIYKELDINKLKVTDEHSTFSDFPVITFSTKGNLLISDDANLSKMDSITGNGGDVYLVGNNTLEKGSSTVSSKIDFSNFSNITMTLSANVNLKISGFDNFYLGSANDTIIYNGKDKASQNYVIDGGEGNNKLVMSSWNDKTSYIEINNDTTTYHRTASESALTLKDFYTIDVAKSSDKFDKSIKVNHLSKTQYEFQNLDLLSISYEAMKDSQFNNVILDGNLAVFSSVDSQTTITASFRSAMPDVRYTGDSNSNLLTNDFTLEVYRLGFGKTQAKTITQFHAPNTEASYDTVLDLRNVVYKNEKAGINIGFVKHGVTFMFPNEPKDDYPTFVNFNEVLFDNKSHNFLYDGVDDNFQDGAHFVAGGSSSSLNRFGKDFTLEGNVVKYGNKSQVWDGLQKFIGFDNARLNISEEASQRMFNEEKTSDNTPSLARYNYVQQDNNSQTKSLVDQMTYTLTDGSDVLTISEVKDNTVVDTMKGDDNIILNGRASDYLVEHFTDRYITLDGKQFDTGGSYLVVTDENGNKSYILNAGFDDIASGGKLKQDEEGNYISSSHNKEVGSDSRDESLPLGNDGKDTTYEEEHSNSGHTDGSNGMSSYGRSLNNSADENQDTPSHFILVEEEGLDLSFDDEINLEQQNVDENQENEDSLDSILNANAIEDSIGNLINESSNENQNISDEELSDMISKTFSKEDDSLDNMDINLESNNDFIDISSISENLVEETVLQESDIDSYKLESERNDDGILKIHNHNGSNGNGSL